MTTAIMPNLGQLTDAQLAQAWSDGAIGLDELTRECDRRQAADKRSAAARKAARSRHEEWETAAYAQYQAASAYCNGDHNMLSEAGKRRGRDAWPMCWEGSEETARGLASDELITFWDYVSPRVPGPGQYAAAKRAAAAEHAARSETAETAPRVIPVPSYRPPVVPVPSYRPPAAREPGQIAGLIRALGALERQAIRTRRAVASVHGQSQVTRRGESRPVNPGTTGYGE